MVAQFGKYIPTFYTSVNIFRYYVHRSPLMILDLRHMDPVNILKP
jgi:hypothetical protein